MVWLAIFATLMTDIIEYLGCGLGIDTTVMGLSLGAIGTSFPNLYASILVAKAGMGGMSICQARPPLAAPALAAPAPQPAAPAPRRSRPSARRSHVSPRPSRLLLPHLPGDRVEHLQHLHLSRAPLVRPRVGRRHVRLRLPPGLRRAV
jgi:hypothetical protein